VVNYKKHQTSKNVENRNGIHNKYHQGDGDRPSEQQDGASQCDQRIFMTPNVNGQGHFKEYIPQGVSASPQPVNKNNLNNI
jgi:hypothetical protein